ncbi:MAG: cytochrome c biosis protein CcmG, thiol:disulfide interchange protein DsbE [Solirubrobacteraceae bacterium]|nr:cytochrome c biosis protein CcmG, thiol:disulfide interchange protein DsbE [Solirubrobacteraceae bacterium]
MLQMRHMQGVFCNAVVMRKAVFIICALAVTAAVVVGAIQAGNSDRAPKDSGQALSLADVSKPLAGAPADLAALHRQVNVLQGGGAQAFDARLRALRGHPVVVNMWASWCEPCRFELPFLQREAVSRGAKVAFLGINVNDAHAAARERAAQFPMPYPSFEDPRSAIFGRYHARGLPTTAFYDARGKLVIVHQGVFPTQAKLAEAIDRYARS